MDKNYKPSERQKNCKNSFPYMGKEMNKTYCRKLMQERKDAGEDDMSVCVSNEQCENCPDYKSGTLSTRFRSIASNVISRNS